MNIYVSTAGDDDNDDNDGFTPDAPKRTLAAAGAIAVAGDHIWVVPDGEEGIMRNKETTMDDEKAEERFLRFMSGWEEAANGWESTSSEEWNSTDRELRDDFRTGWFAGKDARRQAEKIARARVGLVEF